jgi:hypothetical protein
MGENPDGWLAWMDIAAAGEKQNRPDKGRIFEFCNSTLVIFEPEHPPVIRGLGA